MKCNELYAETQKQTLEKNKLVNAAKKLNESRKAELYTRLNEIVFDGLDLNPDNSGIVIGKDDVLSHISHTSPKIATMAKDYSVLTVSIPLSSLKKPYVVTTAEDINALKLCDFIRNFDELCGESLANRIVDLDSEKLLRLPLPIFEMRYLIKENETIQKLCAEHNQYLVRFEVACNPAETKKSKEMTLDFKFGFITNKSSADDLAKPLNLDKAKSREDHTDPLIKSAKIAEEIIDAFKKTKTTPPNCGSHVKRECECECKCHDDGVPNTAIKIIEVKDPNELPKVIRDLLGNIL